MLKLNVAAVCGLAVLASTTHASASCYTPESDVRALPQGTVFEVQGKEIWFDVFVSGDDYSADAPGFYTERTYAGDPIPHAFECSLRVGLRSGMCEQPPKLPVGYRLELIGVESTFQSQVLMPGLRWYKRVESLASSLNLFDDENSLMQAGGYEIGFAFKGNIYLRCNYETERFRIDDHEVTRLKEHLPPPTIDDIRTLLFGYLHVQAHTQPKCPPGK